MTDGRDCFPQKNLTPMGLSGIAGFAELAKAETANTYGVETPKLRSRAGVSAVLGTAPKPAADASRRPLTMFFTGRAKDHPPKSHSHDGLPIRWNVLPGGGFVFNTIHNILADVAPVNIDAMLEAVQEFGGDAS